MDQQDRLHALDAVRAFALLLGIFYHAALSFGLAAMPGSTADWVIRDNSPSTTLLVVVGSIHIFRMSLFFFIAGFFAHLVYHRKGAAAFARDRAKRIALPFVVAWCLMVPLLAIMWHWGHAKSGLPVVGGLWPSANDWRTGEVHLTHLWFLYYLILFYVLVVGVRHVAIDRIDPKGILRTKIDRLFVRMMDRRWAPVVLSLPIGIAAIFAPDWNGSGMPTPDHSLWPELIPVAGYGAAFATGWVFHRNLDLLSLMTLRIKSSLWLFLVATILSGGASALIAMQTGLSPGAIRFFSGVFATMMVWYLNFAIIGFALKKFSHPSTRVRYVADASYWLYIAHLPLVCALQVWVANWPLHWSIKYLFILIVSFALLFASYEYMVRYSFVGAMLNGRKHRPTSGRSLADTALDRSPVK